MSSNGCTKVKGEEKKKSLLHLYNNIGSKKIKMHFEAYIIQSKWREVTNVVINYK